MHGWKWFGRGNIDGEVVEKSNREPSLRDDGIRVRIFRYLGGDLIISSRKLQFLLFLHKNERQKDKFISFGMGYRGKTTSDGCVRNKKKERKKENMKGKRSKDFLSLLFGL